MRVDEIEDVPADALARVQRICDGLPEMTYEADAWAHSFRIRRTNLVVITSFADADGTSSTVLSFRAEDAEVAALVASGHPWFATGQPGRIGMVVDATADWAEVAELVVAGYRLVAPRKLVALLD